MKRGVHRLSYVILRGDLLLLGHSDHVEGLRFGLQGRELGYWSPQLVGLMMVHLLLMRGVSR